MYKRLGQANSFDIFRFKGNFAFIYLFIFLGALRMYFEFMLILLSSEIYRIHKSLFYDILNQTFFFFWKNNKCLDAKEMLILFLFFSPKHKKKLVLKRKTGALASKNME